MARELNTEYFSGSQASIFIGDVWVDEIIDWQCSLGANAVPIYGYGDTFWSHAAQGRVIVQGSFTINFKEPNYLFAVLARYQRFLSFNKESEGSTNSQYRQSREDMGELDSNANPYSTPQSTQELNYVDKRKALDEFFAKPAFDMSRANDSNYIKEIAKAGTAYEKSMNRNFKNSTISSLDPRLVNDFAHPLFDIKIGYGTVLDQNTIGEQIVGVKLIGKGKTIMANGEPLKESYSFFAKTLV